MPTSSANFTEPVISEPGIVSSSHASSSNSSTHAHASTNISEFDSTHSHASTNILESDSVHFVSITPTTPITKSPTIDTPVPPKLEGKGRLGNKDKLQSPIIDTSIAPKING